MADVVVKHPSLRVPSNVCHVRALLCSFQCPLELHALLEGQKSSPYGRCNQPRHRFDSKRVTPRVSHVQVACRHSLSHAHTPHGHSLGLTYCTTVVRSLTCQACNCYLKPLLKPLPYGEHRPCEEQMIGKLIRWIRRYIHFEDTPKTNIVSPPGNHGVPPHMPSIY